MNHIDYDETHCRSDEILSATNVIFSKKKKYLLRYLKDGMLHIPPSRYLDVVQDSKITYYKLKPLRIIVFRSAVFGFTYTIATALIGDLLNYVLGNISIATLQSPSVLLSTTFISGFLIGLTLGTLTKLVRTSRLKSFFIWTCIVFFNIASVIIEGVFFAPGVLPVALMPRMLFQYFLLAIISSLLVLVLFPSENEISQKYGRSQRSFFSWSFGFLVSALSYLLFYFIFGALNYELFTKPYYQAQGGLAVPELKIVMTAEAIRAGLIILSIVPLLTALSSSKKRQMLVCGLTLFIIGGIVPLLMQIGSLPTILLFASAVEIFFQNFLTGATTALMLGSYKTSTVKKGRYFIQQQL